MKKTRAQVNRSTRSAPRVAPVVSIKSAPTMPRLPQQPAAQRKLAMLDRQAIRDFLERCSELAKLCTQNGWVDNDTLTFEVRSFNVDEAIVTVFFDEVIKEGSGSPVDRVACFGKLRVLRDGEGAFVAAEII